MVKTVGLKTRPTALRRQVGRGEAVIVTRRGKPVAALTRLTDADLEEFVLRYTSRVAADGGATAPGQPAAPSKYRYMSVPAPFGTIFVAYGPNGPLMVSPANSPAAFERGGGPGPAFWAGGAAGAAAHPARSGAHVRRNRADAGETVGRARGGDGLCP